MEALGVSDPVAKAEGAKYNSRSFRWVIVMLVEEAEAMVQPWACSRADTLAIALLVGVDVEALALTYLSNCSLRL